MAERSFNTLFLCTGNSARSIIAESLLRHWGGRRFRACSAGSRPRGEVHPLALEILQRLELPVDGLHSKGWEVFAGAQAPRLDFVITVCDRARGEACPVWPGQPLIAHWGVADPVGVEGDAVQRLAAFRRTVRELENRIRLFVSLPIESLDALALEGELARIGRLAPDGD